MIFYDAKSEAEAIDALALRLTDAMLRLGRPRDRHWKPNPHGWRQWRKIDPDTQDKCGMGEGLADTDDPMEVNE